MPFPCQKIHSDRGQMPPFHAGSRDERDSKSVILWKCRAAGPSRKILQSTPGISMRSN